MDKAALKDHRQIGQELDLFSFHDVAPGAVFWHPKGWHIFLTIQKYIREILAKEGYTEISSPVMVKSELFKKSGHWDHYKENMFNLNSEAESYSLKPMNCPESTLIYSTKTRSYQDLPIRYSDFGILHRNELSGTLGGLFRVRQMSQDDAHLYVRPDQISDEIKNLLNLIVSFYKLFKFETKSYLSTKPDKAMGDPKLWINAETALKNALESAKVEYGIKEKDGAFYGPKIDIHIKDSQDRDWQVATVQLDFQIPERMGLEYVDKDGTAKRPVMIHRAITGSLERFIGILTEQYQGAFPLWLAPTQVIIMPITDKQTEYAKKLTEELKEKGIRAEMDNRPERLQAKIRDGSLQKVPYLGIIGDKEIAESNISVRLRDGKDLGKLKISEFLEKLKEEIDKKI
ncbi:MAG: threonine--tRNA ligase [bacterium]|nr:threonine--tRNA ligase [bacterium]